MARIGWLILVLGAWAVPALADSTSGGLKVTDIVAGTGEEAVDQAKVAVNYTGWLENGDEFDSSRKAGRPIPFVIGAGQVIPGWEIGIKGMRVGGQRELVIPPELAYGPRGRGPIPPNATLRFRVELVDVVLPPIMFIGNEQMRRLIEAGVKVVDVRTSREWGETGVVRGSTLITAFDELGRFESGFPAKLAGFAGPQEKIVVVCRTGSRARRVAEYLNAQAGYRRLHVLKDGIESWIADGYPVAK